MIPLFPKNAVADRYGHVLVGIDFVEHALHLGADFDAKLWKAVKRKASDGFAPPLAETGFNCGRIRAYIS